VGDDGRRSPLTLPGSVFGSATAFAAVYDASEGGPCVTLALRHGDRAMVWAGTSEEAAQLGRWLLGESG
jgi:hypothetical protein